MHTDNYAVVVGGINIDIGGKSFLPMLSGESNPGKVRIGLGGVGRNIAHNLRLMGADVRFLTAFGEDMYAYRIEASCAELNIDISKALKVKGGGTPVYLYLNDADGDMLMAVSDMALCDSITPDYLSSQADLLRGAKAVAADTNIPAESLRWLAEHFGASLFVDPVSVRKAAKLKGLTGMLHTLKANTKEAELLSGIEIKDRESLASAARAILGTGTEQLFITLGKRGALAADRTEMFYASAFPAEVNSTTGAGDAFMASLVRSCMDGACLEDTLRRATAAASLTAESTDAVNSSLTPEKILLRAGSVRTERFHFE